MSRICRAMGAAAVAAFAVSTASAQQVVQYFPHSGEVKVPDARKMAEKTYTTTKTLKGTGISFTVTYEDVENTTGAGFADPTEGANRRATAEAVLLYIDSVLNETGACDVVFELTEFDGSGFLATMGPFFFVSPGYSSGFAFEHISTGVDPCTSCFGGLDGPDMSGTVDFGYTWNADGGAPAGGEYDLFSVLLHEISHGLGFLSLMDAAGGSEIGSSKYSHLDEFMERGTGTDFFTDGAGVPVFLGAGADLISDDVVFVGTNAVAALNAKGTLVPALFAPTPFQDGSSLSHLDAAFHPTAVMNPSISAGVSKQTYSNVEIGMLQDFGYGSAGQGGGDGDGDPPDIVIPPGAPVGGLAGLALVGAGLVAGGYLSLRRKK